jgi:hypothetical protein
MGKAAGSRSGPAPGRSERLAGSGDERAASLRETESWFAEADLAEALSGRGAPPPASLARGVESLKRKAPIALGLADRFIREGAALSLDRALALELGSLEEVFATHDAYAGLTSLGGGRAPVFEGR